MIESGHKKNKTFTFFVIALLVFIFGCWLLFFRNELTGTKVGSKRFYLETVATADARQRGLSDRDFMAKNTGMLFVFDQLGQQCMWMKDMKFNLDIIWLDEQKKITDIKKNLAPDTFPKSFCASAKYVLELNAGMSDAAGLQNGQQLNL